MDECLSRIIVFLGIFNGLSTSVRPDLWNIGFLIGFDGLRMVWMTAFRKSLFSLRISNDLKTSSRPDLWNIGFLIGF